MNAIYDLVECLVDLIENNPIVCVLACVWAAGLAFCACGAAGRAVRLARFKNRKKESESEKEGEMNEW